MSDVDTFFNTQNPSDSLLQLKAQLSNCDPHTNPALTAETLALIGRAHCQLGNPGDAVASLEMAEQLLEKHPDCVAAKIRWLLEMGRYYIAEHTPARARLLFKDAWMLSIKSEADYFTVEVATLMAEIETPKSKEVWLRMALELAEDSDNEKSKKFLGSIYANLGWMLFDLRQLESSLELFRKNVEHLKSRDSDEYFSARWAHARLLRALDRAEEALPIQNTLLMELHEKKDGRVCEEIAECLLLLNRPTEAVQFFRHAYNAMTSSDWVQDRHPMRLKRMKDMGRVEDR